MTQLACWAIPVRGGYVLRGDHATQKLVVGARNRRREFTGWHIALIVPEDVTFVAERARRPATLAIDYASRQLTTGLPTGEHEQFGRLRRSWLSVGLGVALLAISGGHWVLAAAGAWLVAGRVWLGKLLSVAWRSEPIVFLPIHQVEVSAEPHTGLTEISSVVRLAETDAEAYGRAQSMALALDLDDVATVYAQLAAGESPETVRSDTGFWVSRDALHDPETLPASTSGLKPTLLTCGGEVSNPMETTEPSA